MVYICLDKLTVYEERVGMPKASILVPIYNVEQYLEQCLASIANQTCNDIEIILVDDGSTDASAGIIDAFAADDERVQVIRKENSGYGDSLNCALAAASGEWISIVEPDDWIEPTMIDDLVLAAEAQERKGQRIDIVKGDYRRILGKTGRYTRQAPSTHSLKIKPGAQPFRIDECPDFLYLHPSIWSALYRRSFIEEFGIRFLPIPGAGWADNPFFLETMIAARAIAWVSHPVYNYREFDDEKISHLDDWRIITDRWADMRGVLDRYDVKVPAILEAHACRGCAYLRMLKEDFSQDDPGLVEAARAMAKSLDFNLVVHSKTIPFEYVMAYAHYLPPAKRAELVAGWIASNPREGIYDVINLFPAGHAALESRAQLKESKRVEMIENAEYAFDDRSKGADKLCIVLAGYKELLWGDVFSRLARFAPEDVDVCIMTSGLVNEELRSLAADHNWSYLSTEINHLSHIQNLAIRLHPRANWVYKLDEDIFLTEGFFEKMFDTWHEVEVNGSYYPAFVAPLINVNGYCHIRLLEKLGLLDDFRKTGLSDAKVTEGLHLNTNVLNNPAIAKYMWGETQPELRDVDRLTERFSSEPLSYSICPIRFSIGAILFSRENWIQFGGFPITFVGSEYGLGDDEEHIGDYAFYHGKAIVVNENVVVGHLGYGPQTAEMLRYYEAHRDLFSLASA